MPLKSEIDNFLSYKLLVELLPTTSFGMYRIGVMKHSRRTVWLDIESQTIYELYDTIFYKKYYRLAPQKFHLIEPYLESKTWWDTAKEYTVNLFSR